MFMCMYVSMHMQGWMDICVGLSFCMYTCKRAFMHVCTNARRFDTLCIRVHVYVYVRVRVCVCVCVCVRVCVWVDTCTDACVNRNEATNIDTTIRTYPCINT